MNNDVYLENLFPQRCIDCGKTAKYQEFVSGIPYCKSCATKWSRKKGNKATFR